jgi:hypothetical protein
MSGRILRVALARVMGGGFDIVTVAGINIEILQGLALGQRIALSETLTQTEVTGRFCENGRQLVEREHSLDRLEAIYSKSLKAW